DVFLVAGVGRRAHGRPGDLLQPVIQKLPDGHLPGVVEGALGGTVLEVAQLVLHLLLGPAVDQLAPALAGAVVAEADGAGPLTVAPPVDAALVAASPLACHASLLPH